MELVLAEHRRRIPSAAAGYRAIGAAKREDNAGSQHLALEDAQFNVIGRFYPLRPTLVYGREQSLIRRKIVLSANCQQRRAPSAHQQTAAQSAH